LTPELVLRPVEVGDLDTFFDHQRDPEAIRMKPERASGDYGMLRRTSQLRAASCPAPPTQMSLPGPPTSRSPPA
jgi:hypothetical protein